jgi:3-hydroxyacyl-[acyl-carrier-protein] dehydratase
LDNWTATLRFAADDPAANGHFPGNPIIPGAVLLRDIVAAIDHASRCSRCEIRSAKFRRPVRPGDTLVVSWTPADGEVRFSCRLADSEQPAVTGVLRFPPQ